MHGDMTRLHMPFSLHTAREATDRIFSIIVNIKEITGGNPLISVPKNAQCTYQLLFGGRESERLRFPHIISYHEAIVDSEHTFPDFEVFRPSNTLNLSPMSSYRLDMVEDEIESVS